jgi:major vault protein
MAAPQESNVVLSPNEFVFVQDSTKGEIRCLVGPYKTGLTGEDFPVIFNEISKKFEKVDLYKATQLFAIAPEGWYIILKNPNEERPNPGKANILTTLNMGRKINIPGPVSFALWPGQMKKVVQGHHLRSNQYLLVRVYDEDEAIKNLDKAIIKRVETESTEKKESLEEPEVEKKEETKKSEFVKSTLTMGKLLIIKGTDVAFYIPPTGIEVVVTEDNKYVREAVTLETLEYCILLNENGNKRYIKGPAVVFPEPTETFIQSNGKKVFKAYELNEISGLYLKVISPYSEGEHDYQVGEELFITGKEQAIYYPRPEHAIIKYGEQEIHHGIAIPAGEGRYSLDRLSGVIPLKKGPCVFLPDPRKEVIIRRILDLNTVDLWYPGNQEAKDYNSFLLNMLQETRGLSPKEGVNYIDQQMYSSRVAMVAPQARGFMADEVKRKNVYTPPRTITLDTKYEGVPIIKVWTGYAILITSKTGKREVVTGPTPVLLEYDETLEFMELSTGTPKSDTNLHKTVYLRVLNNKVSDIVKAETKDLCPISIQVSYRVNFEGESSKWFNVENYVKFLTDHLRSLIKNTIKQCGIEEFYSNSIAIIRDCVLGKSDGEKRPGRSFDENGMRVYECEVLNVELNDQVVRKMLVDAQASSVQNTINLAKNRSNLSFTIENEDIKRKTEAETFKTFISSSDIKIDSTKRILTENLEKITSQYEQDIKDINNSLEKAKLREDVKTQDVTNLKIQSDYEYEVDQQDQILELEKLKAENEAEIKKVEAVSKDLIAALQSFGDKITLEKVAQSLAPLALLGGGSLADVVNKLIKGTVLEGILTKKVKEE